MWRLVDFGFEPGHSSSSSSCGTFGLHFFSAEKKVSGHAGQTVTVFSFGVTKATARPVKLKQKAAISQNPESPWTLSVFPVLCKNLRKFCFTSAGVTGCDDISTEHYQVNSYRWVFSFPVLEKLGLAFKRYYRAATSTVSIDDLCIFSSSLLENEVQTPWVKPLSSSFSSAATAAGTELEPERWNGQQVLPCSLTASEDQNNRLGGNVPRQQCSSLLFCFVLTAPATLSCFLSSLPSLP